jgi:hypothetical protein
MINTYKKLFETHFAFPWTTFLRIWSKGGNFYLKKVNKNIDTVESGKKMIQTQWKLQDHKIWDILALGKI